MATVSHKAKIFATGFRFQREDRPARMADNRFMAEDKWYLTEWRKHRAMTLQQVADAVGMSVGHLSDLERGKRGLSGEVIRKLATVYGVSTRDLLAAPGDLEGGRPRTVPLVGYVGAGAAAHFYAEAQGPLDYVPAPENATDKTVAVEIRGESIGSFFDTWLVYYDDVRSPVTSDLLGRLCVVGLPDTRVLVKKIQKSRSPGLYHLLSQTEDPILDQEVAWAARVTSLAPR